MPKIRIVQLETIDAATRLEMIDCWQAVTEADGAVGFRPGEPREAYENGIAEHEASMAASNGWLFVMYADDELAGFAWWIRGLTGGDHVATLKRLQVHPRYQGLGLGKTLMNHMHAPETLALLDGVFLLHLQYRVGRNLGAWYASYGYTENARYDLFIKQPDGSYGGWAEMIRTRDGSPLPINGAL
ncbi:MAG: GNAT family N-acetyltransferase [Propionibacteriaceae bacterium]